MEKIESEIFEYIPIEEADIAQYFGKIRNGKTYIATRDAVELLNAGLVVYANWKIKFNGYDERDSKWNLFLGLLGLKKTFIKYPKENFHFLPINEEFFDKFARLTDCRRRATDLRPRPRAGALRPRRIPPRFRIPIYTITLDFVRDYFPHLLSVCLALIS